MLRQVPERHLPMAGTPAVTDLLKTCDSEAPLPSFRHLRSRAWLGVALDNVLAAGDPMTFVAEVLGGPADEATQMWVRVSGAGRTDPAGYEQLRRMLHVWSLAVVAASQPGYYEQLAGRTGWNGLDRTGADRLING